MIIALWATCFHKVCYRCFVFQINLIAPPLYVVTTQTLERTDGLEALNKAIGAIKLSIEDAGGMFNIQLQVGI